MRTPLPLASGLLGAMLLLLPLLNSPAAAGPLPEDHAAGLLAPGEAVVLAGPRCADALTPASIHLRIAGAPDARVALRTIDVADGWPVLRSVVASGPVGEATLRVLHPGGCTPATVEALAGTGRVAFAAVLFHP